MSQEKVDKRKYEKHHRKEIQKKQKRKTIIYTVIGVLILGTAIGIPLGYKIYDMIPKKVSANDVIFNAWVSNYVQQQEGYPFVTEAPSEEATDTDTSEGETAEGQDSQETAEEGQNSQESKEDTSTTEAVSEDTGGEN